jgi:hypothetical protein
MTVCHKAQRLTVNANRNMVPCDMKIVFAGGD